MNVAVLIKAISLLSSAMPIIAGFVTQVETLMPATAGSDKFKAVEAAVSAYFTKIVADADVLAHLLPKVGGMINGLVALFNASGVFTKATVNATKVAADLNTLGGAFSSTGR